MEDALKEIQQFNLSPLCIFSLNTMDYPTPLQQRMISGYFELKEVAKKNHNDIVRLMHSLADRQLQNIIFGVIYSVFLDSKEANNFFETYMIILRSEAWIITAKLIEKILKETFDLIKFSHRQGLSILLGRLYYFGQLGQELLVLTIKSMDSFSLQQQSLNYSNVMVQLYYHLVKEQTKKQHSFLMASLCSCLFYKLVRVVNTIYMLDDENVEQYKGKCISLLKMLFDHDQAQCLISGQEIIRHLCELERQEDLQSLVRSVQEQLRQKLFGECRTKLQIISVVLPFRVQKLLLYIFNERISHIEINIQMNWLFKDTEQQYEFMCIDILDYVLYIPKEQYELLQKMHLLDWLLHKCCSNNVLFELWRGELFSMWFLLDQQRTYQIELGLHFVTYMLHYNPSLADALLSSLLRNRHHPSHSLQLKHLINQGHESGLLKLKDESTLAKVSPHVREELNKLLYEKIEPSDTEIEYSPFGILMQEANHNQLQFSDDSFEEYKMEDHYLNSGDPSGSMNQLIDPQEAAKPFKVILEKQFAEDLQPFLTDFLSNATVASYSQLLTRVFQQLKGFKKNNEVSLVDSFITETAKVTYLMLNHQFEDYSIQLTREESGIFYLLTFINSQWKVNSLNHQNAKKIVRKIIELFPTTEPAFWRYFLLYFKRGTASNIKQFKDWLIAKQKTNIVLPLLNALMNGNITKTIVENASLLKLSL